MKIVDTIPAQNKVKPLSFKWVGPNVDKGTTFFPNPTEFWVAPRTAGGRAARDTVPGLWNIVYKRLTGLEGSAKKWKG